MDAHSKSIATLINVCSGATEGAEKNWATALVSVANKEKEHASHAELDRSCRLQNRWLHFGGTRHFAYNADVQDAPQWYHPLLPPTASLAEW